MIDPIVRPAVVGDIEQLRTLEAEARSSLGDQRGGGRWLETHLERRDGWAHLVERDRVFVATIDEVSVGYIVVGVAEPDRTSGPVVSVDEVYVTVGARELGFGDALLAAAIGWARSIGASLVEAEALPGDRDTKNLYERAGIKARMITVSTEL